jgi:GH25 family lysozyme M1 (1,4-beta-N-acetylmuramidase)
MPIYAIDLYSGNYYPGFTLPLKDMYDHGFRMACIKASMGGGDDYRWMNNAKFDTVEWYTKYFRDAGWDVSLYHWVDPVQALQPQIDRFRAQLDRMKCDVGLLDWEQNWGDWTKWAQASRGEIPWADVPQASAAKNLAAVNAFLDSEKLAMLRQLEIYTYAWFPSTYVKLAIWPFSARKPWIAAYPALPKENIICESWKEFEEWVPKGSPISWAGGRPAGLQPNEWSWWQVQSGIYLPGCKDHYDYSIFNGDEEAYNSWIGKAPPPPPVPWEDVDKDAILRKLAEAAGLYP